MFKNSTYSPSMLIGSVLAGIVYSFFGEIFYHLMSGVLPGILVTAIYFTGLFLVVGLAVYLIGELHYKSKRRPINMTQWLITFILILALSAAFEFIYEIIQPKSDVQEFDSYVFLIDNSGSMTDTDPQALRYTAIEQLLEDKPDDFEFAVYSFSDDLTLVRPLAPKSQGIDLGQIENWGGTAIKGSIQKIVKQIESGELDIDNSTRIVLLSDGHPTDMIFRGGLTKSLKKLSKKGITVSTVGLMHADEKLMEMIASKTNGVFVNVNDAADLKTALEEATAVNKIERNLLGYRDDAWLNWLLAILRILFVATLGVVTAVQKTVLCEKFIDTSSVLYSSGVAGILAGICIEIGMNMFGIAPILMRLITCGLIGFTLLRQDKFLRQSKNSGMSQDTYQYGSFDEF